MQNYSVTFNFSTHAQRPRKCSRRSHLDHLKHSKTIRRPALCPGPQRGSLQRSPRPVSYPCFGPSGLRLRQWRIYGAFGDAPLRVAHPNFFAKNLREQYMDIWCKAICCRHIYFKTVPECIKTRHCYSKNCKIIWGGDTPSYPILIAPTPSAPTAPRPSHFRRSTVGLPLPTFYICHWDAALRALPLTTSQLSPHFQMPSDATDEASVAGEASHKVTADGGTVCVM